MIFENDPIIVIGALRNILHNLELGMDIDVALRQTANEMIVGVKEHKQGNTHALTHDEMLAGQLIGRIKV